jgi:integrase
MKVKLMATVRKRGNSYQIRASAGYGADGQQIIKSMTWTPTDGMTTKQIEKELNRVVMDFERHVENGECIDSSIHFSDYAAIWLRKGVEGGEKPLAPKTLDRYKALLVRINAAIGHIRLRDLQPHHIREFLENLKEEGIREDVTYKLAVDLHTLLKERSLTQQMLADASGLAISTVSVVCKGKSVSLTTATGICTVLNLSLNGAFLPNTTNGKLSEKTVLHHYRLISAILNGAVTDDQALLSSPAKRVRPPHCGRVEAPYLDEVQAAHMIELLENEPIHYKTMVLLLLYSGMRRGELCGLEWHDIDFNNHLISISRTSQYTPGKGIFVKGTKTASSVRTIKLPTVAIELLREYRKWQTEQRLAVGDQWEDCDRIYTSWNGKPAHPDTLTQWFVDFIKRTDLPPIHIHSLRHTNATLMIAGGENIRTVSQRLGHAQVTTTANTYTHAIQSADAKAAETLENILDPYKKRI